jgi:hypothetical protein
MADELVARVDAAAGFDPEDAQPVLDHPHTNPKSFL